MFASVSNFKEPSLEIPSNSLDSQHQTETEVVEALDVDSLKAKIESAKASNQTPESQDLHALSLLLFQQNHVEEAIDVALQLVRQDKDWEDRAGVKLVNHMLDSLGSSDHPLVKKTRARLSNYLFI